MAPASRLLQLTLAARGSQETLALRKWTRRRHEPPKTCGTFSSSCLTGCLALRNWIRRQHGSPIIVCRRLGRCRELAKTQRHIEVCRVRSAAEREMTGRAVADRLSKVPGKQSNH
jgi:hypothetical protein